MLKIFDMSSSRPYAANLLHSLCRNIRKYAEFDGVPVFLDDHTLGASLRGSAERSSSGGRDRLCNRITGCY